MARGVQRSDDLATVTARRDALLAQLAEAEDQVRAAAEVARDAGRPTLMAALERVKVPALAKAEAKAIAAAIARHGGKAVAENLATLGPE